MDDVGGRVDAELFLLFESKRAGGSNENLVLVVLLALQIDLRVVRIKDLYKHTASHKQPIRYIYLDLVFHVDDVVKVVFGLRCELEVLELNQGGGLVSYEDHL